MVIAGRACDTAIFAALPTMLGFPDRACRAHGEDHRVRLVVLRAGRARSDPGDARRRRVRAGKHEPRSGAPRRPRSPRIACTSRPIRSRCTSRRAARSAAARSTRRWTTGARRVAGAAWRRVDGADVKIEGARQIGERAVLLAGAADPRFIAQHREILPAVADGGARTGVRGPAAGLHAALPGLRRGRRAHGRAGRRAAAGRGVRHGRMHRADRGARRRSGAHAASSICCITAIRGGCRPRATWRFRSRRRKFRWARPTGSTSTTCCTRRIPTRCSRWRSKRYRRHWSPAW